MQFTELTEKINTIFNPRVAALAHGKSYGDN